MPSASDERLFPGRGVSHPTAPLCPHLGLPDDPETACAFPAGHNTCYAGAEADTIPFDQQQSYCLSGAFADCPRLQETQPEPDPGRVTTAARRLLRRALAWRPPSPRTILRRLAQVVAPLLLLLLAGSLVTAGREQTTPVSTATRPGIVVARASPTPTATASLTPSATATATPSPAPSATNPAPTNTATHTPRPTHTPSPQPTTTPAPTGTAPPSPTATTVGSPTPDLPQVRVTYSSVYLRRWPHIRGAPIRYLFEDDVLYVLERSRNRAWYKVLLPDGTVGWVAISVVESLS